MTNKDQLLQVINNLNEIGINSLLYLFGNFDKIELYNINTTPERIAELQQIDKQKEEQRKAQYEEDRERASFERAQAEYKRQTEFKAALTGREKKFFELIESVKPKTCYCLDYWEMILLADAYNNNLINGCYDIFRYGFLKGQRAEKNRRKRAQAK